MMVESPNTPWYQCRLIWNLTPFVGALASPGTCIRSPPGNNLKSTIVTNPWRIKGNWNDSRWTAPGSRGLWGQARISWHVRHQTSSERPELDTALYLIRRSQHVGSCSLSLHELAGGSGSVKSKLFDSMWESLLTRALGSAFIRVLPVHGVSHVSLMVHPVPEMGWDRRDS